MFHLRISASPKPAHHRTEEAFQEDPVGDRNYKSTLNLPKTAFPMRANLPQREPGFLKTWAKEDLYAQMMAKNAEGPRFILHDGPPYANGHLHAGHVLNKVLKDIIVKMKNLQGYFTEYIPGWDCHGLPIERNVEKDVGRELKMTHPVSFRRACREYAKKFVKIQKKEFQRLGCVGDWENPYLTMDYAYEARILEELGRMAASGAMYRGKKPVHWCYECETALAEAEVEYHDHRSTAVYVRFPLNDEARTRLGIKEGAKAELPASVVIWTTTPWTLPANLAVALHPDLDYVAIELARPDNAEKEILLVAEGLLSTFLGVIAPEGSEEPVTYETLRTVKGATLEGAAAKHPWIDRASPFVVADYVTLETGTGCVHTAPGHGQDDYETGLRYGLEPYSPVDDRGRFTKEVPQFEGRLVFESNKDIVAMLRDQGKLVASNHFGHSYPHCWRSKTPIIFRSTEQWFVSMDKTGIREKALSEIDKTQWIPEWGHSRIHGMVKSRPDWCISRQRHWGIPIVALRCTSCDTTVQTPELFAEMVARFKEHGADVWFELPMEALVPQGTSCPSCSGTDFKRERDILDVWFDSGVSFAAVIEERYGADAVTDLYLEGSDQHRGWFHSALLTSVATRERAPYKAVLTHGFTVDGEGKKLSKSVGNGVAPEEIIAKFGAELLRLWVASEDYRDEVSMSNEILSGLSDAYRKIRNTLRFLVANLGDFDPNQDRVAEADMNLLDQMMLARYRLARRGILAAFETYEFHKVVHQVLNFFAGPLSAMYMDFLKDRLYAELKTDAKRRSSQTVLHLILEELLTMLAPIGSFTADEAWRGTPHVDGSPETVFLASWPKDSAPNAEDDALVALWQQLTTIRDVVSRRLEDARNEKLIGHPLESSVELRFKPGSELLKAVDALGEHLREALIVSELHIVEDKEQGKHEGEGDVDAVVSKAAGEKCPRCWLRAKSVGASEAYDDLCERCASVVTVLDAASEDSPE